jgi:hypothetical protein
MMPSGSMASSQWNRAIGAGWGEGGRIGVGRGGRRRRQRRRRDFRFASYPAVGELGRDWTSVWVENSGPDTWAGLSAFGGPDVRGNTKLHP